MALNKRKVLDTARKFAQKGAKQKALKEYNKLVQADPRDAKVLLEIGDAYRRWGQAEEAIAQYQKVANQYKQDGFDARAVAVLKQILNLDPKRYTAHVGLADLYQRMGLDSDAVGALRTAADGYYRDGRRREALELLRRMAALDPSNTTSRLKVADLLHQEGMDDEAVAEYEDICEELRRQGATEQVCSVQERLLELRPDHVPTLTGLARDLSDLGRPERAVPFAVRALEQAREPEHFELLAGIYKSLGDDARLAEVTRELAAYYKGRGEEDRAREVLQRLPPDSVLEGPGIGTDRSEVDQSDVDDEDLLEDEEFLVTDATDQSEVAPPSPSPEPAAAAGADVSEDDLPEGDPEQLLAEASVYLRYGKRVQAIASLRSALRQEPGHRGALEKLGEAYAEDDRAEEAIGCFQQALDIARADGDAQGFAVLRDRIGALDPEAAAGIAPMGSAAPASEDGAPAAPVEAAGDEIDFDVDVSVAEDTHVASDEDDSVFGSGDHEGDLSFDLDVDDGAAEVHAGPDASSDAAADDAGIEIELDIGDDEDGPDTGEVAADDSDVAFDFDSAMEEVGEGDDVASPAPPPAAASADGQSTTTAARIRDDLEEAEFYLQQGLEDEAEGIYRRILSLAPNHPMALLKLGELAARRGQDPAAVSDPGIAGGTAGAGETAPDEEDAFGVDFAIDEGPDEGAAAGAPAEAEEPGVDVDLSEDLASVLAEAEASVSDANDTAGAAGGATDDSDSAPGDPVSFDGFTDDETDTTEEEPTPSELAADEGESFGDLLGEDATEVETLEAAAAAAAAEDGAFAREPVDAEPRPPRGLADDTLPLADDGPSGMRAGDSATAGGEAAFDLAAELADVFGADDQPDPNATSGRSTVEDGFESLFASFKKGVSATLDEGDFDTRFDLAIAYREMGLFEDAIAEFRVCLDSASRRIESLHMMALCAIELGRPGDGVSHLEQALAGGDLPADLLKALHFDLGRAQRLTGDTAAARRALEVVRGIDAGFPGLAEEWAALESGAAPGAAQPPPDDLESFQDLLSDDDDDAELADAEPEAEPLESFDDVITDVVAEPEPSGSGGDRPATPEVDTDPGTSRPGRKKKRISFV